MGIFFFLYSEHFILLAFPPMSLSSRLTKVKPKGVVQELKLVDTISRNGKDVLQTEEVKTPRRSLRKGPSANPSSRSSSPTKRRKLEDFDWGPTMYDLEDLDVSKKRQTLVFLFLS
jgi:hypothetical protein